ncbi:cytochrome P450 [Russula decolorans]
MQLLINVFDCFVISCFLYLLVVFRDHRRRRGLPYPPGPPSRPIIGNLLDFPKDMPWSAYAKMSKKHGDVICLRFFSEVVVVLCSLSAIKDLLEKRGEIYSDRPSLPIAEMTDMDWPLFMTGMTETWREGRKLVDHSLRPGAVMTYGQMMQEKTREFLTQLFATPKNFRAHIELLQGKFVMSLIYGYDLKDVRHIPSSSWVPYFSYEPFARIVRELSQRIRNEPLDFVKNALAAFSMYSFFLALALFPQVQRRAQAEVDVVVGRDRLPTFDDRPRLSYITALCKELLRWQMVTPIGVPHLSSKDDVYRGYFIPKGSTMVANAWAILHDPEIYPDPEEFKPERFLNEDGSVRDDPTLSLVFGVGKRICPGRHFADAIIFIVTSSVLSVFNVMKTKDENDNEIPVKAAVSARRGVVIRPEKFECSILPRDKVTEDLILANTLS